jgi:hypothetical protein
VPFAEASDAEVLGERLAEIGERRPRADVDAAPTRARQQTARARANDRCSASSDRCRDRR